MAVESKTYTIDGHDESIIGIFTDRRVGLERYIYDGEGIIRSLVHMGMTDDDAREYCDFNIEGAYIGPGTPLIVWDRWTD
jgi:hypothetical protein